MPQERQLRLCLSIWSLQVPCLSPRTKELRSENLSPSFLLHGWVRAEHWTWGCTCVTLVLGRPKQEVVHEFKTSLSFKVTSRGWKRLSSEEHVLLFQKPLSQLSAPMSGDPLCLQLQLPGPELKLQDLWDTRLDRGAWDLNSGPVDCGTSTLDC